MDIAEQIKLFIEPNSVALIGVSNNTDERLLSILPKMFDFGFSGKIYVINRHSKEILGIRAYPDLKSVPGSIDLAVVSTAPFSAPDIVRECVDVGVKAIIITSQGFADADAEGVRLQQEIVRIAKKREPG